MPYITETEYSNIQKQLGERSELLDMCVRAREAIDSLPIDALGNGTHTELNGKQALYPVRDELVDKMSKVIAKAKAEGGER